MQGLRGTFFQHGSFLELVSLVQKQALFSTGTPGVSSSFAALAVILSLHCVIIRGALAPPLNSPVTWKD